MIELKQKRTYTAKHFQKENGEFVMHAHIGHIHYNNKLGLGDGVKGLRGIDWTLSWDEQRRGWTFVYHSFHPFIPEYADGWVLFRDLFEDKDQSVGFKADCLHIRGRLVTADNLAKEGLDKLTSVNCVIYDNAFGKGFDYIVYFTRSTMRKVVRIRDGFKPKSDVSFRWQVRLPKRSTEYLPVYRTLTKEKLVEKLKAGLTTIDSQDVYSLRLSSEKVFDTPKQTLIGEDKLDGKEWFTYFRPFYVWDNSEEEQREITPIRIYPDGLAIYLEKTVKAEFLAKSVGDVFTDTTTSYIPPSNGDNSEYKSGTSWSTVHNSATGVARGSTTLYNQIKNLGGTYYIERAQFVFDTSSLPNDATINSATFKLHGVTKGGVGSNGSIGQYNIFAYTGTSTTPGSDDYNECGTTSYCDTSISYANWDTGTGYGNTWALNSTGLGAINKTDYTKISLRDQNHDADNVAPAVNYADHVGFTSVRDTSNDPYLEVTYGEGGTAVSVSLSTQTFTIEQPAISVIAQQNETVALACQTFTLQDTSVNVLAQQNTITALDIQSFILEAYNPIVQTSSGNNIEIGLAIQTFTIEQPNVSITAIQNAVNSLTCQTFTIEDTSLNVIAQQNETIPLAVQNFAFEQPNINVETDNNAIASLATQTFSLEQFDVNVSVISHINISLPVQTFSLEQFDVVVGVMQDGWLLRDKPTDDTWTKRTVPTDDTWTKRPTPT